MDSREVAFKQLSISKYFWISQSRKAPHSVHCHFSVILMLCFHCICFKISQKTRCWKLPTSRAPCCLHTQALVVFLTQADAEASLRAPQSHRSAGRQAHNPAVSQTDPSTKQKSRNGPSGTYTTCSCYFGAGRLKFSNWAFSTSRCWVLREPDPQRHRKRLTGSHEKSSRGPIWFDLILTD